MRRIPLGGQLINRFLLGDLMARIVFVSDDFLPAITGAGRYLQSVAHAFKNKGCDVFVLPSVIETLSLAAIEVMSFKKPIIVTNKISCAEELVDHGQNGFIVDSENVSDCTQRLIELSKNSALREGMGRRSFEKSKLYNFENTISKIDDVYHRVLDHRSNL